MLVAKRANAFWLLLDVHSDHLEATVLKLTIQLLDGRHFGPAGRTPGRPEIDQDDLAGKATGRDGMAGQVIQCERWRYLPRGRARHGRYCLARPVLPPDSPDQKEGNNRNSQNDRSGRPAIGNSLPNPVAVCVLAQFAILSLSISGPGNRLQNAMPPGLHDHSLWATSRAWRRVNAP